MTFPAVCIAKQIGDFVALLNVVLVQTADTIAEVAELLMIVTLFTESHNKLTKQMLSSNGVSLRS